MICGIAVMVNPAALSVTPLATLVHISEYLSYSKTGLVGPVMFMAGIMAVLGGSLDLAFPRPVHMALFFPQQLLLLLQLYSITVALITGVYPDGYIPQGGAFFILSDQIWAFILACTHSVWLAAMLYFGGKQESGTNRIT
jgi:hypothetical protein